MGDLVRFLTESAWTYPLLLGIVAGDAVFPLLPSETAMIVCGLQAARGQLSLGLVMLIGTAGAFLGDNTSYAIGRFVGRPVTQRLFMGERAQLRFGWAREQLRRRGAVIVLVARFVPGGRTAVTFTAGVVKLPWGTRFAPFSALAAVTWSVYAALLGYLGGRAFENRPWLGLLVALGLAFAIGGVAEGVRRLRRAAGRAMPNIHEPHLEPGDGWRRDRIGEAAGAEHLGLSLYELEPGQSMVFHYHVQREELLIVLSGTLALRTGDGWEDLREGEVVAFPRGERGAHGYANRAEAPVRVLVASEQNGPNVSVYPDTNQVGVFDAGRTAERRFGALFNVADAVSDYGGRAQIVPPAPGPRRR